MRIPDTDGVKFDPVAFVIGIIVRRAAEDEHIAIVRRTAVMLQEPAFTLTLYWDDDERTQYVLKPAEVNRSEDPHGLATHIYDLLRTEYFERKNNNERELQGSQAEQHGTGYNEGHCQRV